MSQVHDNRMESTLPRTMALVRHPLQLVEQMLADQLSSDIPIIDEMVRCGAVTGGKRFRPALLLLAAHANGEVQDHHIMLATAVEMIHAATLVHDDIIDKAQTRRHVSTINHRWGNQGAVLFGDYLFTQAFYLASLTGSARACQIIGQATNQVCTGELQQSDAAGNYETTVGEYFQIITRKTAALCECAAHLGASFTCPADVQSAWQSVGRNFGLAFQIVDDVLDFQGDAATCGKTLGTDLATGKPTLPLLLALQASPTEQRIAWTRQLAERQADPQQVRAWLKASGAIEASTKRAFALIQEGWAFTNTQSPAVAAAFQELGQFLLARVR